MSRVKIVGPVAVLILLGAKDGLPGDEGRFPITHDPAGRGAFKTPTLREVASRAPHLHDGSLATLDEVMEHYDRGGTGNPALGPALKPLHLTVEEKRALAAFLRALSGTIREGN